MIKILQASKPVFPEGPVDFFIHNNNLYMTVDPAIGIKMFSCFCASDLCAIDMNTGRAAHFTKPQNLAKFTGTLEAS